MVPSNPCDFESAPDQIQTFTEHDMVTETRIQALMRCPDKLHKLPLTFCFQSGPWTSCSRVCACMMQNGSSNRQEQLHLANWFPDWSGQQLRMLQRITHTRTNANVRQRWRSRLACTLLKVARSWQCLNNLLQCLGPVQAQARQIVQCVTEAWYFKEYVP